MALGKIEYAKVERLRLDPTNPRIGRENLAKGLDQDKLFEVMLDWNLEELAVSFLESGFWPQETLIVVPETWRGEEVLVVAEGNRRLAAILALKATAAGKPPNRRWERLLAGFPKPDLERFAQLPVQVAPSRDSLWEFIGFRHVTGIQEWSPAEKAQYIARMIDERGMDYVKVMRRIGSKTPTVRQNYISFHLLRRLDEIEANISTQELERKFSLLFLSTRARGVQIYVGLDMEAEPSKVRDMVKAIDPKRLARLGEWLFGSDKKPPLVPESRDIDRFGKILQSNEARAYIEGTPSPDFSYAYMLTGAVEEDIVQHLQLSAHHIREALSSIHHYKKDPDVIRNVDALSSDLWALFQHFPEVKEKRLREEKK